MSAYPYDTFHEWQRLIDTIEKRWGQNRKHEMLAEIYRLLQSVNNFKTELLVEKILLEEE